MVHRGPFQTGRGRPISTNGLDDSRDGSYKNALICRRWIAIRRSRCYPPDLIMTVITPAFKPGALIGFGGPRVYAIDKPSFAPRPIQCTMSGHVTCI